MTTMTIRIAICDDEKIFADDFYRLLSQTDFSNCKKEVALYYEGAPLLDRVSDYDLIFLDIKLNETNGINLAKNIRDKGFLGHIVFLTNYPEYMPDAFAVRAFRYLTKPVSKSTLATLLSDVEKDLYRNKKISFPITGGEASIWQDDILYIEAVHNSTFVYTRQNMIKTRISIRDWLKLLPSDRFIQSHRSYIISLRYTETITNAGIRLSEVSPVIPIARGRIDMVKEAHLNYLDEYGSIQ